MQINNSNLTPLGTEVLIASVSDTHFGKTPNASRLYEELKEVFLKWCETNKPNLIVVAGDLTDRKLHMNSDAAKFSNLFIHDLFTLSEKGSTVLLIHGTASHDNYQLLSYTHYLSSKFKIYTKATIDFVESLRLLILPEEYNTNSEEYYKPFLDSKNKYDFVFGHGLFKHAGGYATDSGGNHSRSAVFSTDQFNNIVEGYVSFGHIHTSVIKDKVIYNGSFSRYNFGEEEKKGFYSFKYKNSDPFSLGSYKYSFIENKLAPLYSTYEIQKNSSNIIIVSPGYSPNFNKIIIEKFNKNEEDKVLKYIVNLSSLVDNIRILPHMDSDDPFYQSILALVAQLPNVRVNNKLIERDITKTEIKTETDEQKNNREKREKYKGMSLVEITKKYAFEEFNEVINDETIVKAMKNLS